MCIFAWLTIPFIQFSHLLLTDTISLEKYDIFYIIASLTLDFVCF
jgi:hypothetical protein